MKASIQHTLRIKLPEMILSAAMSACVGLLIYKFRGISHAPYVCAIIGGLFPLFRSQKEKKVQQ
ncbi:MAG: hypothetical protein WCG87_03330 [Bacteroidota bacterium]